MGGEGTRKWVKGIETDKSEMGSESGSGRESNEPEWESLGGGRGLIEREAREER